MSMSVKNTNTNSGVFGPSSSKKPEKTEEKPGLATPKQTQIMGSLMSKLALLVGSNIEESLAEKKTKGFGEKIQEKISTALGYTSAPEEKPKSFNEKLQETVKGSKQEISSGLTAFAQDVKKAVFQQTTLGGVSSTLASSAKTLVQESGTTFYQELSSQSEVKESLTKALTELKSPLGGPVKKFFGGLAKGLGMKLLKTEVGRNFLTSVVSTKTRVTTEKILEKASTPEQKAEWSNALAKLDIYEEGKPGKIRVDREGVNLGKIKAMQADTPSLQQLKDTLIKKYEVRVAVKDNLSALLKTGAKDTAMFNSLATTVLSNLGSPESLMKTIFNGLSDPSTGLKDNLTALLKDESTSAIIKAAMGDKGVDGLLLLISDPGLKVISPLIQHLSVDTALDFINNPVQALSTHGDELSKIPSEIFTNLVSLLTDKASQETISQLSGGKVTPGDIQLAADVLPMMKELATLTLAGSPIPKNEAGISLPSQIVVKVAEHLSTRLSEMAPPTTQGPELLQTLVTDIRQATDTYLSSVSMLDKAAPQAEVTTGTISNTWGGWLYATVASPIVDAGASLLNAGTELAKDGVLYVGSNAAGALISKEVTAELDKAEGKTTKAPKEKTTLTLNQKKLENLALQTVSLMSQFVVEHPEILDKSGAEVGKLFTAVAETLQNTSLSDMERSARLTDSLSDALTTIGKGIQQEGSPLATDVGKTLEGVASVISSDLVQLSLGRSSAFSTETLDRVNTIIDTKIAQTTEKVIGEAVDNLGKKAETKAEKKPITVKVSPTMAKAIQAGSYMAANEGGWGDSIVGSIFSSLSLGMVSSSVKLAGSLIEAA